MFGIGGNIGFLALEHIGGYAGKPFYSELVESVEGGEAYGI